MSSDLPSAITPPRARTSAFVVGAGLVVLGVAVFFGVGRLIFYLAPDMSRREAATVLLVVALTTLALMAAAFVTTLVAVIRSHTSATKMGRGLIAMACVVLAASAVGSAIMLMYTTSLILFAGFLPHTP